MPSPDNALQAAVYQRLAGYAPLAAALGGPKVYDFVAPELVAPYVVIGEDTLTAWDTKTNAGWDCTLTLHCWDARAAGRKSVKALLGLVHDALHRQERGLAVAGFALVELAREFQTTVQEAGVEGASDHYYHGVARYRALLEPSASAPWPLLLL